MAGRRNPQRRSTGRGRFHPFLSAGEPLVDWWIVPILFLCLTTAVAAPLRADNAAMERLFELAVRPTLVNKCVRCHGERKQEGNLRVDSLEFLLRGGDSGPAIDLEHPEQSLLLQALRYEGPEMPPDRPLDTRTVEQIGRWLKGGAVWPKASAVLHGDGKTKSASDWWAMQPLSTAPPPDVAGDSWSRTPIDRFVYAKMQEHGITPAPPADRWTLVRRAYFDLLGVPPTPAEIAAVVHDPAEDAWEHLIDKLLDDPRYGEHWGRYWLDLVRYAESDGWKADAYRPHIWRYRDYVITSFNEDKPFARFVLEQLAGDELAAQDPAALTATGFLRLGIYEYNQRDARNHWNDIMNETTDVVGDVFFGLSMACARCHDHKFDPILQEDYYRLRAFFEPMLWRDDQVAATHDQMEEYERRLQPWLEATREIRQQIDDLVQPYHDRKWRDTVDKFPVDIQACFHMPRADRTSWQQQMAYLVERQFEEEGGGPLKSMSKEDKAKYEQLQQELAKFNHLKPSPLPPLMTVSDFEGILTPTTIPDDPARRPIAPGFLSVLEGTAIGETLLAEATAPAGQLREGTTGRRTMLARWITSPHNPLTGRVIVNRLWQHHFGRGLVDSPNDFGAQGSPPTHPELLDWLVRDFVKHGGRFKRLHKMLLMSATWQQSAVHPQADQMARIDPQEQWLWRWRVRRLRAEQIRDAMLVASGRLQPQLGGPSVDHSAARRSIYVKQFRNRNDTFLHGFDMANGLHSVAVRDATTTPLQALLLFNGDFPLEQAHAMAERILQEVGPDDWERAVEQAFLLTWGRLPPVEELMAAQHFVHDGLRAPADEDKIRQRLADFCHVLLNTNQFLYVD
ncbi:MAG: cytochrome c [Pirellulaceae bacterium]|nr:MAG: cytochrome c [Pirellulaceae bacterium]